MQQQRRSIEQHQELQQQEQQKKQQQIAQKQKQEHDLHQIEGDSSSEDMSEMVSQLSYLSNVLLRCPS